MMPIPRTAISPRTHREGNARLVDDADVDALNRATEVSATTSIGSPGGDGAHAGGFGQP